MKVKAFIALSASYFKTKIESFVMIHQKFPRTNNQMRKRQLANMFSIFLTHIGRITRVNNYKLTFQFI